MGRKLKRDISGPDWRRDFDAARSAGVDRLFSPDRPVAARLVVEIGFGRGEFLTEMARRDPAANFLGLEVSYKRVLKLARRLAKSEIENVRLIEGRAERVLDELLDEQSVFEFWLNFPDPWPKKRHARRRLIQPVQVSRLGRCLVPGGVLNVATDDRPYAEQIRECLAREECLENAFAPDDWREGVPGRFPTAYELQWRAQGRPLHFFCYRRLLSLRPDS